ncbi:RNA-guided endonuclease InsQ/TnpB family protein [Natronococcus occultus]|uniref:RNA-guided endonuclease InsQ/TnpB family protein n=1 Tax=Natronococcus occultus TaxID=29288 RepID=UPI001FE12E2A|nr:transposase [Natronococcus occultus]
MDFSPRFRLYPTTPQREALGWQLDTVRQVYNDGLKRYNDLPPAEEDDRTVKQRVRHVRDQLPVLKNWWEELNLVWSTVLQEAVERIQTNITNLGKLKAAGYDVGSLNWKSPREYQSFTYRQSGFELDKKSGRSGRGRLILKKVNGETLEIPIRLHRDIDPDNIKNVTVKRESSGAWYASFDIEAETPEKPDVEDIDPEDTVGLDLGIVNFVFDSDGRAINRLDLSDARERLEREQRPLSRKHYESRNWEKQREAVAAVHESIRDKKRDYHHKLAHFYTTQYDAVFVEDFTIRELFEGPDNARNKVEVGWGNFKQILDSHGEKHACHVMEVPAYNTTTECYSCGVEVEKELWVREHACPSCGFETDRDYNAALNVKRRGLRFDLYVLEPFGLERAGLAPVGRVNRVRPLTGRRGVRVD